MDRKQLEHIIRASLSIAQINELYIMGSQSVLGQFPDTKIGKTKKQDKTSVVLKKESASIIKMSMEADILVKDNYFIAEKIEGSLGEDSIFHNTYGYYVQAIDETTCILPRDWKNRLIPISVENGTGYCLEVHDMILSKLIAMRPKDIHYFKAVVNLSIVNKKELLKRLDAVDNISIDLRRSVRSVIRREFSNEYTQEI